MCDNAKANDLQVQSKAFFIISWYKQFKRPNQIVKISYRSRFATALRKNYNRLKIINTKKIAI